MRAAEVRRKRCAEVGSGQALFEVSRELVRLVQKVWDPLEETPMNAAKDPSIKEDFKTLGEDIQRLAGNIRLKVHLAGMDAKTAWNDVEPKLVNFEKRVEETAGDVGAELKELGSEVRTHLVKIRDMLAKKS